MPRRSNRQPRPNPKYANDAEVSNLESNETFSIDSNGPYQTVKMPASNKKAQRTSTKNINTTTTTSGDKSFDAKKDKGSPKVLEDNVKEAPAQTPPEETTKAAPKEIVDLEQFQEITNEPAVEDKENTLSEGEDLQEFLDLKVEEQIHHQNERLFDILEDLDRNNRNMWKDCMNLGEGITKLRFLKERLTRIKEQSIDLPEFLERRPLKDQPGFAYINRILRTWNDACEALEVAKGIVYNSLPVAQEKTSKKTSKKTVSINGSISSASILADQKEKSAKDNLRMNQRETARKKGINTQQNKVSTQKNKVEMIYGDQRGKALNTVLNRPPPSRVRSEGSPVVIKSQKGPALGTHQYQDPGLPQYVDYGSIDGHLQLNDLPPTNLQKKPESLKDQNTKKIKILPRGVKLEDFIEENEEVLQDEEAQKPQQQRFSAERIPPQNTFNNYKFSQPWTRQRNLQNTSMDDWVCVQTDRHPENNKPKHYGKIRKFTHLFQNCFQQHMVYDPYSQSKSNSAQKAVQITKFDGRNCEYFREFEQGVLIKIINDETLDWTSKFYLLLSSTSGAALNTIQSYTDDLDMAGFIQALEDLYYHYGQTSQFRDALIHQLMSEDPIDPKKTETLQRTNALIKRILRTFAGGNRNETNDQLTMSFFLESVKMTDDAKKEYRTYLTSTNQRKGLPSFTKWLSITYEQSMDVLFKQKHVRSARSVRPPVLMETPIINEIIEKEETSYPGNTEVISNHQPNGNTTTEEEHVNLYNQASQMINRCALCFDDTHKYADCSVYMSMNPDQRKLALLRYHGCYTCTDVGHTSAKCNSHRSCQSCQSTKHHESICQAASDSWEAVKHKKWNKSPSKAASKENINGKSSFQANKASSQPSKTQETSKKVTFLVDQGEENNGD